MSKNKEIPIVDSPLKRRIDSPAESDFEIESQNLSIWSRLATVYILGGSSAGLGATVGIIAEQNFPDVTPLNITAGVVSGVMTAVGLSRQK